MPIHPKAWKTITRKPLVENKFMRLYEEEFETDKQKRGVYYVMDRNGFAAVVPLWPDGSTLLVGQWRQGAKHYSWEFPMGGANADEDFVDVARRELEEETGLVAGRLDFVAAIYPSASYTNSVQHIFVARDLSEGAVHLDEFEDLELLKIQFDAIEELIMAGKMNSTPTIAMYFLVKKFLEIEGKNE